MSDEEIAVQLAAAILQATIAIGQSRTQMLLLKKAHLGEVSVTVWPKILKEMCHKKSIHVLE